MNDAEPMRALIAAELNRLARRHESAEAFEALFRILWLAARAAVAR